MAQGYTFKTKSTNKICRVFKQFKAIVENEKLGYWIQKFRCNIGKGEYTNLQYRAILNESGIILELSAPYTQYQNGVSEWKIQLIQNTTTTMMHACGLPEEFWTECASTAIYLLNHSPTLALDNTTPYTMWYNENQTYDI